MHAPKSLPGCLYNIVSVHHCICAGFQARNGLPKLCLDNTRLVYRTAFSGKQLFAGKIGFQVWSSFNLSSSHKYGTKYCNCQWRGEKINYICFKVSEDVFTMSTFSQTYQELYTRYRMNTSSDLSPPYGLYAYDALWSIALALDRSNTSACSNGLPFEELVQCIRCNGKALQTEIERTNFTGISVSLRDYYHCGIK